MLETTRLVRDLVALPSVNPMRADIPADITVRAFAKPEGQRVLDRFGGQMCRTRPSESSAASPIASDIVGWA